MNQPNGKRVGTHPVVARHLRGKLASLARKRLERRDGNSPALVHERVRGRRMEAQVVTLSMDAVEAQRQAGEQWPSGRPTRLLPVTPAKASATRAAH
ncbi:MAG: hypothetical protein ACRDI2_25590, partial [Chloroflexota bacterium]